MTIKIKPVHIFEQFFLVIKNSFEFGQYFVISFLFILASCNLAKIVTHFSGQKQDLVDKKVNSQTTTEIISEMTIKFKLVLIFYFLHYFIFLYFLSQYEFLP